MRLGVISGGVSVFSIGEPVSKLMKPHGEMFRCGEIGARPKPLRFRVSTPLTSKNISRVYVGRCNWRGASTGGERQSNNLRKS